MTTTTTQRENLSPHNGRVPVVDSPAVRARARARIAATHSDRNRFRLAGFLTARKVSVPHWRTWAIRPGVLRDLWNSSAVDPKRIPDNSSVLRSAWLVSNWTDRLLLLAVITLLPTPASRPLRWTVQRPTRRYGLYLTVVALAAAYLIGRN
jgi:hypothetical protein